MSFNCVTNLDVPKYSIGSGYVYVLEIKREDGEKFYYVGSTTTSPDSRIKKHKENNMCRSMPVVRGGNTVLGDTSEQDFTITAVERIVTVNSESRDRLLEVERETAYRVAIDHGTTNISGVQP